MAENRVVSALRPEDVATALGYDAEFAEALRDPAALALVPGPRTPVFAATSYSRSAPRHIGGKVDAEQLAAYFAALDSRYRRLPVCVEVDLDEIIVRDRTIYLRDEQDLTVVYETAREIDRPYVTVWNRTDPGIEDVALDLSGTRGVFLASAGSNNYGHWLIDDLPRAAWIAEHREEVSILLPSAGPDMDAVRLASLRMMIGEPMPPVKFLAPASSYVVSPAAFVTPVSHHPMLKLPEAMHHVRARAVGASGPLHRKGRRLFVTRAAARGREVVNGEAVAAALTAAGFEIVDPESLSFERQVETFASAEMVVGLMGAAMTNTIFSPAGCRIGYLSPEGWTEPFYWDLANVMGHPYFALFGENASPEQPAHLSSFLVDLADLARLLEAMGAA